MSDFIIIVVLLAVLGTAAAYVIRSKKNGAKCVGCPHAKTCGAAKCGCKGE